MGSEARVRLSAFDQRRTPEVKGRVGVLSADRLVDGATGRPYYLAQVELRGEARVALGELSLVPGMPAEVFILTGERSVVSYLVKPAADALTRAFREE